MFRKIAFVFISLLVATGAMAECSKPSAPEVMDGNTSDIPGFLARHGEMSQYQAAVATYQECLAGMEQTELQAGTMTEERAAELVNQSNEAVGEAEVVAAEHNEQVRIMLGRDEYKEYAASKKK